MLTGMKSFTADNVEYLDAIRLALEGKNSINIQQITDLKNNRPENVQKEEELSDVEDAKLKNKN